MFSGLHAKHSHSYVLGVCEKGNLNSAESEITEGNSDETRIFRGWDVSYSICSITGSEKCLNYAFIYLFDSRKDGF